MDRSLRIITHVAEPATLTSWPFQERKVPTLSWPPSALAICLPSVDQRYVHLVACAQAWPAH